MTRPSKREIERELDDLNDGATHPAGDRWLIYEDPETGEWYDDAGLTEGPLDKDSTDPEIVIQRTVVEAGYDT